MSINVFPAFAVPMAETFHPEPTALNAALIRLILALEAQGAGYRNPDPVVHQPQGLFESEFEFFARDEACVQALRVWVWSTLGDFLRDINSSLAAGTKGLQIASHTWFHVTRDGGYFGYHNHPMASWSGVYCVADGDPSPDFSNNGCLVFPHPQVATSVFLDAANATLRWPFSHGNFVLNLKPGQLVLFPSWLGHYVTPFHGSGQRITVAFNAWFSRGD
ncbi:MAG: putative 2OG-Fe(II) oxygenase [Lysobacteraceae bacterium]